MASCSSSPAMYLPAKTLTMDLGSNCVTFTMSVFKSDNFLFLEYGAEMENKNFIQTKLNKFLIIT